MQQCPYYHNQEKLSRIPYSYAIDNTFSENNYFFGIDIFSNKWRNSSSMRFFPRYCFLNNDFVAMELNPV